MGWTSYHANYYKKNGTVDRKKECDAYFEEGLNAPYYRVVKSALVGSVYYAAVETLNKPVPKGEPEIWGMVMLTSVDNSDYYNFSYKPISEDMGPMQDSCPASILSLLSPVDSEYAIDWRKRCWKHIEEKKNPHALKNLPVGSVIRFCANGKMIELYKHPAAYQFKRPFWYNKENHQYVSANRIDKYEVVKVGK